MIELAAFLLCGFILFMFGVSLLSLSVIAVILILSFLLLNTLSFIFKFGFWILIAFALYYFLSNKNSQD